MKKAYTLIELLAVIAIIAIISAIAYPKIIDVIGSSKIKAYDISKKNIIESAKLKYLADANNALVTEYSVVDLINDGYIRKDTKNPLTNDDYKDEKVVITNENGDISIEYVDGKTLYNIISDATLDDGLYKEENIYLYKGNNAKNYISFNGEIYRILKTDLYRNVYIIKSEDDKNISKSVIDDYISCYYNDNYSEKVKKSIKNVKILEYNDYVNSYDDNDTFILNNSNIWVNNNGYKVLDFNNNLTNLESATAKLVVVLNNNVTIESGNGTQLNPYIVSY